MNLKNSIVASLFAAALAMAPAAAAQTGHQAHDQPKKTDPAQAHHKMTMPAMDDAHFVEMMMKHHQDGIAMAKVEESKGTRDDVKALAAKIREGQEEELKTLEAHAEKHATAGAPTAHADKPKGTAGHEAHDAKMQEHHKMMEDMAKASMQKLESATGADIDHAFAHEMGMHHEMALEMIAKTKFKDAELRKFAQKMAAAQKKELQQLKAFQTK